MGDRMRIPGAVDSFCLSYTIQAASFSIDVKDLFYVVNVFYFSQRFFEAVAAFARKNKTCRSTHAYMAHRGPY